jgi:serine/threonine protein kinase
MLAPHAPDTLTAESFLARLRAANIAPPKHIDKAAATVPAAATPRQAADCYVKAGVITRYQAERLLAGKADGFHIDQYVVLEPLGKATAHGRVFKARHQTMNRVVALKVLAAPRTSTPAAREAVQQEARVAAKLAHPNVVTALDFNQLGERMYLVVEYVDGLTLDALVRDRGKLPIDLACEYVRQAAAGMQHAHDRGQPHGRFGPANLIVACPPGDAPTARSQVKVLNFGMGRLTTGHTTADTGNLTAASDRTEFLAPEQLEREDIPATAEADRYSLGCTLYYLLAGHPPRPAGDKQPLFHQQTDPVPIEQVRPGVPPVVASAVRRLMSRDPAARPTAGQLADWLATAPDGTSGRIEFSLPRTPTASSGSAAFLSGFTVQPDSPFAHLDDDDTGYEVVGNSPTLDTTGGQTPLSTRRPRRRDKSFPTGALAIIALSVILAAAACVAVVVRAVGR